MPFAAHLVVGVARQIIRQGANALLKGDQFAAEGQKLLRGEYSLDQIAQWVESKDINPQPKSGKQELLENIVNRYV